MKIGVAVVSWNSDKHIERCLRALWAQDTPFDEIVLIDNGEKNLCRPSELSERCKYIRVGYNSGFAKANNIAFDILSDCQWIALVNPDAFLEKDWLKRMLAAIDANPGIDCFSSRLLSYRDPSVVDGEGDIYHISGLAWRYLHGMPTSVLQDGSLKDPFSACAAAALIRYDALKAVGGFDPDFFCYFEDVDLGFRLRLAGYKYLHLPEAVAYHVGYASSNGRHSDFAIYHGHRNMVWTYIKNMPGWLFWAFLPAHLVLNFFSLCWFSLLGYGRIILKSKIDAIKKIPSMWRKRNRIQKERIISCAEILRTMDKSFIPRLPNR